MNTEPAAHPRRPRLSTSTTRVPAQRGHGDRVAVVHQQAKIGLTVALAFAGSAVVAGLVPHHTGAWLPLHLFLVGTLVTAISSATQLLAVTWSSSPPPSTTRARTQLLLVAAGTIVVAAGRESSVAAITAVGGAAVIVALALLVEILIGVRTASATDRFAPAIDTYIAAIVFAIAGTVLGVITASGGSWLQWTPNSRQAHIDANLLGFVGLIIAGTLPFFAATQARTKMSRRATPGRVRIAAGAMVLATITALTGRLADAPTAAAAIGYGTYAAALVWLTTLLPRISRRHLDWAGPRLVQLASGLAWWCATTALLAVATLRGAGEHTDIVRALIVGGYAQILVASLAYFGPVLRASGHQQLTAGFATTRSWTSVLAGNAAGVAALIGSTPILTIALIIWAVDIATRHLSILGPIDLSWRSRKDHP